MRIRRRNPDINMPHRTQRTPEPLFNVDLRDKDFSTNQRGAPTGGRGRPTTRRRRKPQGNGVATVQINTRDLANLNQMDALILRGIRRANRYFRRTGQGSISYFYLDGNVSPSAYYKVDAQGRREFFITSLGAKQNNLMQALPCDLIRQRNIPIYFVKGKNKIVEWEQDSMSYLTRKREKLGKSKLPLDAMINQSTTGTDFEVLLDTPSQINTGPLLLGTVSNNTLDVESDIAKDSNPNGQLKNKGAANNLLFNAYQSQTITDLESNVANPTNRRRRLKASVDLVNNTSLMQFRAGTQVVAEHEMSFKFTDVYDITKFYSIPQAKLVDSNFIYFYANNVLQATYDKANHTITWAMNTTLADQVVVAGINNIFPNVQQINPPLANLNNNNGRGNNTQSTNSNDGSWTVNDDSSKEEDSENEKSGDDRLQKLEEEIKLVENQLKELENKSANDSVDVEMHEAEKESLQIRLNKLKSVKYRRYPGSGTMFSSSGNSGSNNNNVTNPVNSTNNNNQNSGGRNSNPQNSGNKNNNGSHQ